MSDFWDTTCRARRHNSRHNIMRRLLFSLYGVLTDKFNLMEVQNIVFR